jgi:hypothetical protein
MRQPLVLADADVEVPQGEGYRQVAVQQADPLGRAVHLDFVDGALNQGAEHDAVPPLLEHLPQKAVKRGLLRGQGEDLDAARARFLDDGRNGRCGCRHDLSHLRTSFDGGTGSGPAPDGD